MPARTFLVRVASRETGEELTLPFVAASPAEAGKLAMAEGWLVSAVTLAPPDFNRSAAAAAAAASRPAEQPAGPAAAPPAAVPTEARLEAMHGELHALRARVESLSQAGILARPAWTIARGILLAWLMMFLIVLALWSLLFMLTIIFGFVISR